VTQGPVSADPERDEDPAGRAGEPGGSPPRESASGTPGTPDEFVREGWRELPASTEDWLTEEEWVAWLASMRDEEDPGLAPGEEPDPQDPPPPARKTRSPRPGQGSRAPVGVPRAVPSARRGPGEPGSAYRVPGTRPPRPGRSPPGSCWMSLPAAARCTAWPSTRPAPGTGSPARPMMS